LLLLGRDCLFAQNNLKKNILGIDAGITIPYSDFAKNTFEYSHSGFASTGGNIEVDFLRYAGKYFGYSLNTGYACLGFDRKQYENFYREILTDQEISVTAGIYQIARATCGFIIKIPVKYKTDIMFIPWIGYSVSQHPALLVTSSTYGEINTIEKSFGKRIITGITLKASYNVTERYGISLSYRMNVTSYYFSDDTSIEGKFWLPVRYQNINIGIYMNLTRKEK